MSTKNTKRGVYANLTPGTLSQVLKQATGQGEWSFYSHLRSFFDSKGKNKGALTTEELQIIRKHAEEKRDEIQKFIDTHLDE